MVKKGYVIFALMVIISVSFVFASFDFPEDDYSIDTVYGPNFPIKGWINISFDDEPLTSLFEDYFDNNITLGDALAVNPSYDYDCSPSDCESDYLLNNPQASKVMNLVQGESLVGIKLTGDISSIDSFSFDISSNAGAMCGESQIKLDILSDDEIEFSNNETSGNLCLDSKTYGCFNTSLSTSEFTLNLGDGPYCEKINISSSPKLEIGAWLKNSSGTDTVTMEIFDGDRNFLDTCELEGISSGGGEYSCEVNVLVEGVEEFFVCTYSQGGYNIRGYDTGSQNYCGYNKIGNPVDADYQIFAVEKEFASFGSKSIGSLLENGESLAQIAQDYIQERYGNGMDCGTEEGCIIPLKLISSTTQEVTLSNLELDYHKTAGGTTETLFYSATETPATVTSDYQRLYLNNFNFLTSDDIDEHDYTLDFYGQELFEEEIEIKDSPIITNVFPRSTASSVPTEFKLSVSSESSKVEQIIWSFGDNSSNVTTISNRTTHTYASTGSYNLKVSVTDENDLTSIKTFTISVALPIDFINERLSKLNQSLYDVREDISEINTFERQTIEDVLELDFIESELEDIEEDFEDATNESEYAQIVNRLVQLDLPESIVKTKESNNFVFIPNTEFVDLDAVQTIGGGEYSNEEGYKSAIVSWQQNNLGATIDIDGYSQETEGDASHLLSFFELDIDEKVNVDYTYYLIIPKLEGVGIQGASQQTDDYIYKELTGDTSVTIYTSEELTPLSLPLFFSPSLNRLEANDELIGEYEDPSTTLWIVAILAIVAIIAIFIYIILKEWYKRKYEDSLFKDRNDLYNMVNYVNNAKKKGLKESEIRTNLKKAGWSSERVRYVMRKYGGKNTGMFDPVGKVLEKVEKDDE